MSNGRHDCPQRRLQRLEKRSDLVVDGEEVEAEPMLLDAYGVGDLVDKASRLLRLVDLLLGTLAQTRAAVGVALRDAFYKDVLHSRGGHLYG